MSHSNLMTRGFHPALKRAGIRRIRFHDLRHTFASLMNSNGEDIVRVSRLMGHATASFTLNVYSHMLPREHDASGDRLASLVFGNKMETVANLPTQRPSAENLSKSDPDLKYGQGRMTARQRTRWFGLYQPRNQTLTGPSDGPPLRYALLRRATM